MSKVITGQFQYPNGTPAASATLQLQLSQDATVTSTSQIAPTLLYIVLDSEGNIPAETEVWANDELSPSGTYYIASVKAPNFGFVYGPQNWPLTGTSPINVNLIPPGQTAPPAQIVIAGDVVVSGIPTTGQIIVATGSTTAEWEDNGGGGGGSFSAITTGENTEATMTVGTGASLVPAGSGVINATEINGIPITGSLTHAGQIPISQPGNATAVWADPLVQGISPVGTAVSGINPVLLGAQDGDGNLANLQIDTDNDNALIVELASGTPVPVAVALSVFPALTANAPIPLIVDLTGQLLTRVNGSFAPGTNTTTGGPASAPINPVLVGGQNPSSLLTALSLDAASNLFTTVSDGTNVVFTSGHPAYVQGTVAVSGSVAVTGTFWPYTLGQQLAANSVPVILPSATITTLTPPTAAAIASAIVANPPTTFNGVVSGTVTANAGTGTFTTQDVADGSTGTTVPSKATLVGGSDGTNLRNLSTDTSGQLKVLVQNTPAVTLASTTITGSVAVISQNTQGTFAPSWTTSTTVNSTQAFTLVSGQSIMLEIVQTSTITGGAVTFEGSVDTGMTWFTVVGYDPTQANGFAQTGATYALQASTNKILKFNVAPLSNFRIRLSTAITGTGSVTINFSSMPLVASDFTVIAGMPAVTVASGQSIAVTQTTSPWVVEDKSTGSTGSTAPTFATEIGYINGTGNLVGASSSNPVPTSVVWPSAPVWLQGTTGTSPANPFSFTASNVGGDTLVVVTRGSISSITDTTGNVWQKADSSGSLWYATNCAPGLNSITLGGSPGQSAYAEFSNVGTFCAVATNSPSGTSVSGPSVVTTAPNTLVCLLGYNATTNSPVITAGSGYTLEATGAAGNNAFLQWGVAANPGTITPTVSATTSLAWTLWTIAFNQTSPSIASQGAATANIGGAWPTFQTVVTNGTLGSAVIARTPNVFKTVSATASGNTALWTPTSGNKFRLQRFKIMVTDNAAQSSAGVITVQLEDASTAIGMAFDVYVPAASISAPIGVAFDSGWIDLGNGYVSTTASNVLNVNLSAALTSGNVRVVCAGCEAVTP